MPLLPSYWNHKLIAGNRDININIIYDKNKLIRNHFISPVWLSDTDFTHVS